MRKRHRLRASKNKGGVVRQLEPLEGRVLLATAREVFNVGNIDTSAPTSSVLTDTKEGPMSNAGGNLLALYLDYRRFRKAGGLDANYVAPSNLGLWTNGSKVGVTIRGLVPLAELTEVVRQNGGGILYRTNTYNAIDAVIPITMLHNLALDARVATVNPISALKASQAGTANNQADETQLADIVRSTYGVTGVGVKIGVISNSVNLVGNGIAGSIATGDLPANGVQVISDSNLLLGQGTDTDEGRAILELVHDIAPGAELAFATALGGQQVFADSIRALRAAGCDIIVDDVVYFDEPFFQAGVVGQAISDVVASGALYVSAAGNSADNGFDTPIDFNTAGGISLVDWDSGPQVDTRLRIALSNPGTALVRIQWDNPYNGIAGNVATDLDVYAFHPDVPSRMLAAGVANNLRTGVPVESLTLNQGRYDLQIRVAEHVPGRTLPTRVKVVFLYPDSPVNGGELFIEYDLTRSGIIGHNGAKDAITVGAVPFYNVPPYSSFNPIFSEGFSSHGTVTLVFDASGNRLSTPLTLLKPEISGIDGVNTSFFTGSPTTPLPGDGDINFDSDALPNFFGTSAAAPNVAASLALIRQASPNVSLDQIRDILQSTAIPLNGNTAGNWEPQGGYGLINTFNAIEPFVSAPVIEDIIVPSNPAYGGLDTITIVFNQQVSNFDISDVRLERDDEGINLLTGNNGPDVLDGGRTYRIKNLRPLTSIPGTYRLTILDSEGDIVNSIGLSLVGGASTTFESIPVPGVPEAPSGVATKVISQDTVRVRWIDNSGLAEAGFQIERSETADFTSRVTRFTINQPNVTVFTDTSADIVGKKLYYRVRAFNAFNQFSPFSEVSAITTPSPGEIILDNESSGGVTINGTWDVLDDVPGFLGSSYLDDLNAGKGTNSVSFNPNLSSAGDYFVYVRWTRAIDRATNVPIDVNSASGKRTFTVNQRDSGGAGWVLLGKFSFKAGSSGSVVFRTNGTNGKVIVDSVRFLRAS